MTGVFKKRRRKDRKNRFKNGEVQQNTGIYRKKEMDI